MGEEKRRSRRIDVNMSLRISDLFKQDNEKISNIDAPIHVTNISRNGIGFITSAELPLGYYFNSKICLGSKESSLYTVVKIIRSVKDGSDYYYGCEFVGLAPILNYIFDEFENEHN